MRHYFFIFIFLIVVRIDQNLTNQFLQIINQIIKFYDGNSIFYLFFFFFPSPPPLLGGSYACINVKH